MAVTTANEVEMGDKDNQKELEEVEHQLELDELQNEPLRGEEVLVHHRGTQKKKKTV